MDLIDDPQDGLNSPEFSVTELSGAIKRVIEGEFGHVRIRGEVGRVSRPRSGHIYLDLKDDKSVISGVIWKGVSAKLETQPEEGMEVVATGRVTTFGGQSKYQIVIEDIKPAGMGALMALLEKRKKMLAAEGLFDPARKRPLPYLPEIIGVVTSPSGAVIRDILHRLRDRFPRKVLIWPVAVQGAKCAPEVVRAIEGFNALTPGGALPRPDLLIVARGGGSVEDLWGFNEESVARAAAASQIPLISAVGHETDTTLIDFVSDKRAPTPTAAAELAVPVRHELAAWLETQEARMGQMLSQGLTRRGQRLRDMARALPRPETLLDGPRQRLDRAAEKLEPALIAGVQRRRVRLADVSGSLRPATLNRLMDNDRRRLAGLATRLDPALLRTIAAKRDRYEARAKAFRPEALAQDHQRKSGTLAQISLRLSEAGQRQTRNWRQKIDALDRLRETLSYKSTLARGYAVVRGDGAVITGKAAAKKATTLEIEFADGRVEVGGKAPAKKKTPPPPAPEQGTLL
ncbi:exodeoxyribonuclease VII large subunit [Sulfitobacter mediterraneus]|uniref:exodeoxyribonuclease VII large subunit n=1 Tax=Sulfitobacter mediterraneus TaxID=83219 RepID=UPI0019330022|nr:exodeoxyribonuclease VII large subunit [Sulfitobacter mediterraneus]MBM1632552.1 exodeoxyribonuclease VII large subunit [Sulfitobacter mediterraneus]MBM1640369.1 exodeoxyribonuclease VII large subunit [Sulfitobacter mediterraneus]MBM1644417.1 exodeoxyribonuclease VII large subunit [Sulfitobacter mediterraneus]MBM1648464.1 exodeoxyribonuclease VII large subunit [Sulfitobacter mediterraneus]MBM1652509.1 exodeoxyribonuclease VII large subunit [Sulfitobacter mediterraneus]